MPSLATGPLRWIRAALAAAVLAALPVAASASPAAGAPAAPATSATSANSATSAVGFHPLGRSMWIWYLDRSDGGYLPAIIARARAAQVQTLLVKAADGTNQWAQFNPALVRALHAAGLHVCAWQYVYGTQPAAEAALGIAAARAGADCLIIDAEAEYEGRYAQAQTYMDDLRAALGRQYAIGLASFPYVDYHPAFPYSVFLGPGGANFSLPQMYWNDIGDSVDAVFAHTFVENRIYDRAMYPAGQTYGSLHPADVLRFREVTNAYGALGLSWWDYAWTTAEGLWNTLAELMSTPIGFAGPATSFPLLETGSKGDQVLWLQEHLASAYPDVRVTGLFGTDTRKFLHAFQRAHRLPLSGVTDAATWRALLDLRPVAIAWTAAATATAATRGPRAGAARASGRARVLPAPPSAALPALAYEVPETGASNPAPCRAPVHGACPLTGPPPATG